MTTFLWWSAFAGSIIGVATAANITIAATQQKQKLVPIVAAALIATFSIGLLGMVLGHAQWSIDDRCRKEEAKDHADYHC